jgi:hypothetical protein
MLMSIIHENKIAKMFETAGLEKLVDREWSGPYALEYIPISSSSLYQLLQNPHTMFA